MSAPGPGLTVASRPGCWVLAATVLGSSIAAIDSTVVGIALPAIGRDFHMSVSSLQWVVTGYLLALCGLLLVGGALGDRYGRRRVFVVGVTWFALASLLCAVAPDAGTLVTARALQGIGGALLTPGSLAILQASFAPEDRGRAIGAWSGFAGVGTAVGPFLGGFLISAVSWRMIFLINLPVAAIVVIMAVRHVPETRDPGAEGRVDYLGAAMVTAGLGLLTAGLIAAPGAGWGSATVVGLVSAGAASLVAFVVVERVKRAPLLPVGIFASRQFSATNAVTFVVYAALGGALFLLPVQLEQVSGYSPLEAGVALLPLTVMMLVLSARSGALAARIGPRLQMAVGPVVVGAGVVLLRWAGPGGSYAAQVLPGVLVLGVGLVITVAPLTATALSSAPVDHAGMASAVNNDVARAGGLIAVAVLPSVAGLSGRAYLHPALFSAGFRHALVIAGVASALGGVIAAAGVRNPRPAPDAREGPDTAGARPERARLWCPLDATPLDSVGRHQGRFGHHPGNRLSGVVPEGAVPGGAPPGARE